MDECTDRLLDVQALKFGTYTLRTGLVSPVYVDFREIFGFPDLLCQVRELKVVMVVMNHLVNREHIPYCNSHMSLIVVGVRPLNGGGGGGDGSCSQYGRLHEVHVFICD